MLNSAFLIENGTKSIVSYVVKESKSVVIPAFIRVLGAGSFANHKRLENVTFEEDSALVAIGVDAFYGTSIKRIKIPARVQLLERCFPWSLEHVQFENVSNLRQISEDVHQQCTELGVKIPSNVEILKGEEEESDYLTSGPMLVPEP